MRRRAKVASGVEAGAVRIAYASAVEREIKALKAEGRGLWNEQFLRIRQAVTLYVIAVVVMTWLMVMELPDLAFLTIGIYAAAAGLYAYSYRLRYKADCIDRDIRDLDPNERLLTSPAAAKRMARRIQARYDKRHR